MNKLNLPPDSFGFDIVYRDHLPRSLGMHCHDFHEMVYVFSGTGKHVTEQGKYDIAPGDLFVVPPGRGHSYEDRERMTLVNIMFDLNRLPFPSDLLMPDPCFRALFLPDESISDGFRLRNKLTFSGSDQARIESVIHALLREYGQRQRAREVLLTARLAELFVDIVRFCSDERHARSRDLVVLQSILQYMSDNCGGALSIPSIARKHGLSQKSLERLFLRSVQTTPVSYLRDLRLRTAAERIRSGQSSITDIAFACGFSDSNHFAKLFRRKYGISPRSFRRKSAEV